MPHNKLFKDYAVGVIPIYRGADGELRICLIQDSKGFWGFPKGHVNKGEKKETAAIRELQEETGISDVTLDSTHSFSERYVVQKKGRTIDKSVTYYVGFVDATDNETPAAFKKEIPQMKWVSYGEALLLIRDQTKPLLIEIKEHLDRKK